MAQPSLVIQSLKKSYQGQLVVDIPHLTIEQGEIFSILGPSGCGKTTLLRLLAGLESPDAGAIYLDGKNITSAPPNQRKINTVFQNYALFPHMTVWENVAFGLDQKKHVGPQERAQEIAMVLRLTQMEALGDKYPEQLSGGQKQRVAIARALVLKPKILLLDEPLAALDLKLRQHLLLELDRIHDEVGINFLFITHDQSEAMSISDRIAVMHQGAIEQIGTPHEIYEAPQSCFVATFIGDTNLIPVDLVSHNREECLAHVKLTKAMDPAEKKLVCHAVEAHEKEEQSSCFLTVRPEKITITKKALPKQEAKKQLNLLEGVVEDIIYLGWATKYWVRVRGFRIMVLRAHHHFFADEESIFWDDQVRLCWSASDCLLLKEP